MRKERRKCVPMEESVFHKWMEDKEKIEKFQTWLDSQSNQEVNQSSTLTSTSTKPSPTKQTYKVQRNYHKKANKIQVGSYIYAQLGPWLPKKSESKKKSEGQHVWNSNQVPFT
jgi:hypothetical protein